MDKDLSTDIKPKVGYIDGLLNQIVPSLASIFEVVIIPHRLNLTIKFRICRPVLDTLIMKSKKIPILFCVDTSTCWRIVVAQIDSGISFQAEQILSRLLKDDGIICNCRVQLKSTKELEKWADC